MIVSDVKVAPTGFDSLTSSSVISAPAENVKSRETITAQNLNEFLNFYPNNLDKVKKPPGLLKRKVPAELAKPALKCKNLESKKRTEHSTSTSNHSTTKRQRKCDNPVRLPITEGPDNPSTLYCQNSACKAAMSSDDTFCRKCSCCICHQFDENLDPTLWLSCTAEPDNGFGCGLSCHIECALQHRKAGVVDHGQFMQLDGSYCCASCGKLSGVIGSWKQQVAVAKDAHQVGILCYRISLSFRLLDGTSRFQAMHEIIQNLIKILEPEVGHVTGVSAGIARGQVNSLSVADDVHQQCSLAIKKADAFLNSVGSSDAKSSDTVAAFSAHFEQMSSSSLVIVLNEMFSVKGYKLWYRKKTEKDFDIDPVLVPGSRTRILVSNLAPSTDYVFRIVSYSDDGDLGFAESMCCTTSAERPHLPTKRSRTDLCSSSAMRESKNPNGRSSGRSNELYQYDDVEEVSYVSKPVKPDVDQLKAALPLQLDLNIATVPDLNDELSPPIESSPDDNVHLANGIENACDGDSALVTAPPPEFSSGSSRLDDNYEYCVKVVRRLECSGHIGKEFRMKFLTWFSLRSTEKERWVVITFIKTLIEEPSCLAGQLLDTFLDTVNCKRPRNGFCGKLWH